MNRLIVHADDVGLAHSVNRATFEALASGGVTSASIMVPCLAFEEAADYARSHPDADLGLHLTLTCEVVAHKWGPVAPRERVSSLVDRHGFFWPRAEDVIGRATLADVIVELRAQIETALRAGVQPTHFDSHMFVLCRTPGFRDALDALAREYGVSAINPFRPPRPVNDRLTPVVTLVSAIDHAQPSGICEELASKTRSPLNTCIVHCGFDDDELRGLFAPGPYDAAWRQRDYDAVSCPGFRAAIEGAGLVLTNWRAGV